MKIFWSWQSDTLGKIGRFLIRDALREAIEELKEAPEIEEPTAQATRESMHLDQDIQGELGSPDLVPAIFRKIKESAVVVADVTLVGQTPKRTDKDGKVIPGKKLINSNVAIELGYALSALTDKGVLLVFNKAYGTYEELPFDLRHKGGAVVFDLQETADKQQIDSEKRKLKGEFVRRLEPYLASQVVVSAPPFEEMPHTFSKATYFAKNETLAQIGDPDTDQIDYTYDTDSLFYLRLIPTKRPSRPLSLSQLHQVVGSAPMLHRFSSSMTAANAYGAISYDPANNPPRGIGKLSGSTQIFQNGEIWSVSTKLIVRYAPPDQLAGLKLPYIPAGAFEKAYFNKLRALIDFATANALSNSSWTVEAGITGLSKTYLYANESQVRFVRAEVITRALVSDDSETNLNRFLLSFFTAVFDATGYERPPGIYQFPPAA